MYIYILYYIYIYYIYMLYIYTYTKSQNCCKATELSVSPILILVESELAMNCPGSLESKHPSWSIPQTGWWFQPLWKIWKSVGVIIPNIWENKSHVPVHQPANNRGSHHLNFTIHAMIIFSNPLLEKWSQLPIISPLLLVVSSFMLKVYFFNVFHGQSLCCMVKPSFFSMCDG